MNVRNQILFIYLLFSSLLFTGCNTFVADKPSSEKVLFDLKSPRETGISFENKLYETDTFNSLFYEYYFNGAGLAIGDVNNDGLSDIFFGGNMEKSRLYLNNGNLKFDDITESSHINTTGKWVTGVSFVDINQDGWLDIYVCVGGNIGGDYTNLLYVNNASTGQLTFSEHAENAGLDDDGYSTQAAFFDYDRDGDLDMYLVTSSMKVPNKNSVRFRTDDGSMINTDRLYRNDGPPPDSDLPRFVNVSKEASITWDGFGLGVGITDINLDGWPDVYVANDYISNDLLYINQGDGTFKDELNSYFRHISYSTMGMDIADFNNDGLTDVFTLDMLPEDYFRKRIMAGNMRDYRRYMQEQMRGYSSQYIRNMLQLNNGKIGGNWSFSEIGQLAGVFETDWSWAPLFADFDNDGLKDLFIGNGIPQDLTNMDFAALWQMKMKENPDIPFSVLGKILMEDLNKRGNVKKSNVIYRNNGDLTFEDKSIAWGMDRPSYSTGSAFSDLDNDGDLDLVLNNLYDPASIYENTTINKKNGPDSNSHYLRVHLSGSRFNRGGIGTKIRLYYSGEQQYYEHFPVRGFQSMVDPEIHFGLGAVTTIDTLKIQWPDGREQYAYNIPTDQLLVLRYDDASMKGQKSQRAYFDNNPAEDKGKKWFEEVSDQKGIIYYHKEREFIDFRIQPLIPHQFSKEGPGITVGDINSDGLDDFFIGGSTGFLSAIFIQQNSGNFTSYPLPDNPNYEDMGSLLFDADGDGDDDLYVVSGGTGLPPGNAFYSDRLYINDGKGKYTRSEDVLPENKVSGSQVTACDIDKDGDLDLFICGRVKLEDYPFPDRSFLLRNDSKGSDKIHFTDITAETNEELEHIGLVASALWTDYDLDGWTDLILVGEWMPVTIFKNDKGHFINMTSSSGLADFTGWWNSLVAADFDKDGDMDYVAGNHGLNSRYKVSQDQPMGIMVADFDNNGVMDPVCSYYVQGKNYPIYHRNIMIDQMPFIQVKYKHYEDYAKATLEDIFGEDQIEKAYKRDSRYFNSAYIENLGGGSFKVHPLPLEAQFAPVFGILANDYNGDGNCDLLLAGNSYSSNVEDGQYDACIGLFLEGDGQGNFLPIPGRKSGFFVDGDAKGMAELIMDDGNPLILVAQNSGKMKVFQGNISGGEIICLNRDDVMAMIHYTNGSVERKEFYYGCGYLSNSSRKIWIPEGVDSIDITTYSDESRTIQF